MYSAQTSWKQVYKWHMKVLWCSILYILASYIDKYSWNICDTCYHLYIIVWPNQIVEPYSYFKPLFIEATVPSHESGRLCTCIYVLGISVLSVLRLSHYILELLWWGWYFFLYFIISVHSFCCKIFCQENPIKIYLKHIIYSHKIKSFTWTERWNLM